MKQNWKPIDYAKASCETMMRKFAAQELPPRGHFHYHQGVFLSGMYQTYRLCGDERYLHVNYLKNGKNIDYFWHDFYLHKCSESL